MTGPNVSTEIPTDIEGEIPRSRDEQGERESEEVKQIKHKSPSLSPEQAKVDPDEPGVEEVPGYDVELPPDVDDEIRGLPSDIDPDKADTEGQINPL